ncbi:hypothetical protein M408DRAFT_10642 [Serendipita vermifera MAFF 305830]|uniref:Uncharacterized protein n=1 Tax=Serendipita vermifera MAFF 305830 TaxID=933852 RepID=A0A0C3AYR8_SERVB|nr:hypothetical protein M408DRAFT_10642 [Serendipita vermifera MAFF 305830]
MPYTLRVTINPPELGWLVENQFKLCISRETNGEYTAIWRCKELAGNISRPAILITEIQSFFWDEDFSAFWSREFRSGQRVEEGCNPSVLPMVRVVPSALVAISLTIYWILGQSAVINLNSSMDPATGEPDNSGKFTIINKYQGALHIGLKSKLNGEWGVCYVSSKEVPNDAEATLTPRTTIQVWLEQMAQSHSMISSIPSSAIKVDYDGAVEHSITFTGTGKGDGKWEKEM